MSCEQKTTPNISLSQTFDYVCSSCKRSFRTEKGLKQHQRHCKIIQHSIHNQTLPSEENEISTNQSLNQHENEIQPEYFAKYRWGNVDEKTFEKNLHFVYEKIVYWRKNLFLLPTGKAAGKRYIDETTRLLSAWVEDSIIKDVAFKAIMVMPSLLFQKPSKKSKSKDHLKDV